jgi:branched-chain amino acid transport system permease protein
VMMVPIAGVLFALGYVMQAGLINPFINRPEHSQFILLVAIAIIIVNALLIIFGPDARNVQTAYAFDSFAIGPIIIDATKTYAGLAAIAVAAVLFAFFQFAPLGKAIRACADNYTGALVVGLDVHRLYALTFGIGAACVGAAGAMLVLIIDVTPPLGPAFTLLAFIIVITGGLGSMPGALLGGILIGVTEAMAGLFFAPSAKSMFAFAILVLVLLFRPQGILGRRLT